MKNIHGTMVVWLQNNVGFTRWGPIESRVEALLDAFRPVREKERDKTQGINRDSDFELRMLNLAWDFIIHFIIFRCSKYSNDKSSNRSSKKYTK